jgi:hypothetical protein
MALAVHPNLSNPNMKYHSLPQKIRSLRAKLGIAVSQNTYVDMSPYKAYLFAQAIDKHFKVTCNTMKYNKVKVKPETLRK